LRRVKTSVEGGQTGGRTTAFARHGPPSTSLDTPEATQLDDFLEIDEYSYMSWS